MKKHRFLALLMALFLAMSVFAAPRAQAATDLFINHPNWQESTSDEVTAKRNSADSFVVMFYRPTCFNSNLRKVMVEEWMVDYGVTVYGVDVDQYSMPSWVFAQTGYPVTLPVICIVEKGQADCFTAADSMQRIQKRLHEYLGILDSKEYNFLSMNRRIFEAYGTHNTPSAGSSSAVNAAIAAEAKSVVAGKTTDYEKLSAIYDWVTANIYYNYGMLDGSVSRQTSAEYTYQYKNSVCSGYANLTQAMCQAVGIPCRVTTGFATGVGADEAVGKVWSAYKTYTGDGDLAKFRASVAQYENHAWNEAFVDGRWVILDTTWGSNNDYYPGSSGLITGTPTREYFDLDLDGFSESHVLLHDGAADLTTTKTASGAIRVRGSLTPAEAAASAYRLLVVYNSKGRMTQCIPVTLKGNSLDVTLPEGVETARIRLFVLDGKACPVTTPYTG